MALDHFAREFSTLASKGKGAGGKGGKDNWGKGKEGEWGRPT